MDDVIWVTYRGRHIPIKPGMKGKFNKKILKKLGKKKKEEEIIKKNKYGDLSVKENYEKAQDDLVLNKKMSVEESEKVLGDYKELYKNSKEGKETTKEIADIQTKINKLEDKDAKTINVEGRDVKVTGLNTDYDDKKNEELKDLHIQREEKQKKIENAGKRGDRATLSEYYRYFLDMGYSKQTALKYAEEQIKNRKGK